MKFDKYEKYGAYHWDWYEDPNFVWYKECVDRCVEFCKGLTADVGGGDGLVAKKIIENGFAAVVLDNDKTGIGIVRDRGDWFWMVDLNDPLFYQGEKGDTYEYMCCLNTIEHLNTIKGITNFFKNCITKGAIIITDKATGHLGRYHEHEYTKEELLETFKEFKPKYFEINSTEHGKPITFIGVELVK